MAFAASGVEEAVENVLLKAVFLQCQARGQREASHGG
jgi:hypothetical protein